MRSSFRLRVGIIIAGVLVFALFLVLRLYFVQIVYGDDYSKRADRQYMRPNHHLYDRGTIYFKDREGNHVAAARLKTGFMITMNPQNITDTESAFQKLSKVLDLDRGTFFERAGKKEDPYEEIAKQVSTTTAAAIEDLNIPGVQLFREQWRYYPGNTLAAHTIGFVGYQGNEYAGRYGLERYYDDTLAREDDHLYVNFFAELFANLNIFSQSEHQAGDVVTTIEPSVQLYLEEKLKELSGHWGSKISGGVIINPKTGEIYAMAVEPGFDLNNYREVKDVNRFSNPLVESVYEMGSIIKPITMAAGLDSGAVTAESTYNDRGKMSLDGYTFSNFDGIGRGVVNMQEVLSQSLNTGVAHVVQKMGKDVFRDYMERFHIGEETGIDLPIEGTGLIENLKSPRDIEYATASFGQGIAMTPINTVQALSVLANGGVIVTPHVVDKIILESGIPKKKTFPTDGERVIKPETAEEITRMLVKVVDEALVDGKASLSNYSIAAKTGTAQIADPRDGGYYDDRNLHSFFGYFPAYDARFLVFLYTVEPRGVLYASQTLTEPFSDIVSYLINYYEVPPDR